MSVEFRMGETDSSIAAYELVEETWHRLGNSRAAPFDLLYPFYRNVRNDYHTYHISYATKNSRSMPNLL